ncbi:hypothetical protein BJ875DRAFT_442165 [Amylocarpus encephaloides]|uniref:Zn(2)-C6 fungal-type domain-containing protein n=1 Tax=Amylocarpus encephaloides TaxID=45428 RepID=A0A9P7YIC7_9HELO|nr:hypothetical protein BJ875DRAFT_442165 [Amylocarpus encephaloides]
MLMRRHHNKTRTGCKQCKSKRTKCDETQPSCQKCCRRGESCSYRDSSLIVIHSYTTPVERSSQTPASDTPSTQTSNGVLLQASQRKGDDIPRASSPLALKNDQNDTLRLMHHYNVSTRHSIADPGNPSQISIWRDAIPSLAFKHDFLLSGLLAVTSLHLTLLRPSHTHTNAALKHYIGALALFRPHLSSIGPDNASALFAFACLVPLYAFGIHNTSLSSKEAIPGIIEVFTLYRGITPVVTTGVQWLENGPFSDFMLPAPNNVATVLSPAIEETLALLSYHNQQTTSNPELIGAYEGAIAMLRITFVLTEEHPDMNMAILPFPLFTPKEYITRLKAREPFALVILAHYAVVLHWLRHYLWLQGWGKEIVEAIKDKVDDDHQRCIQWCIIEVEK